MFYFIDFKSDFYRKQKRPQPFYQDEKVWINPNSAIALSFKAFHKKSNLFA